MWTAVTERLPEPNTLVLTSDGAGWATAFLSRSSDEWREWELADDLATGRSVTVTHWMALPKDFPFRGVYDRLPLPQKLSLVEAGPGGGFHVAFRDDPRAPHHEWKRRAVGQLDAPLPAVVRWSPLPRLPSDPEQGFHS